jgi:hypothetical protein
LIEVPLPLLGNQTECNLLSGGTIDRCALRPAYGAADAKLDIGMPHCAVRLELDGAAQRASVPCRTARPST